MTNFAGLTTFEADLVEHLDQCRKAATKCSELDYKQFCETLKVLRNQVFALPVERALKPGIR